MIGAVGTVRRAIIAGLVVLAGHAGASRRLGLVTAVEPAVAVAIQGL
jgi:hypothetical protein